MSLRASINSKPRRLGPVDGGPPRQVGGPLQALEAKPRPERPLVGAVEVEDAAESPGLDGVGGGARPSRRLTR